MSQPSLGFARDDSDTIIEVEEGRGAPMIDIYCAPRPSKKNT
jgi:hypothetical protein